MFEIRRYTSGDAASWNQFVAQSKNGTFLFDRAYMDYHSDRFTDYSLMFYRKNRLYALLPANTTGDGVLWTHQGLTYGGILIDSRATAMEVMELFQSLNTYLYNEGFCKVIYKAIPWIYHRIPAEEDLFALLHQCRATIIDRSIASVLMPHERLRFTESRRSGLRKALREGLYVVETQDVRFLWPLLTSNLRRRYQARPVHSAEEMDMLKSRFPDQIRIYVVKNDDGQVLGGTVLYLTPKVVHTQYISASPQGKQVGAIDLLFDKLLNEVYNDDRYFDFGTSMTTEGSDINEPLLFQKEGFGARAVCYDWYGWDVTQPDCQASHPSL